MTNDLISQVEALLGRFAALKEHAKLNPNAVIFEMTDIRDAFIAMVPELVEEIKRLQMVEQDAGEELTIAYMLGSKNANDRLKVLQDYVGRLEPKYIDSNAARRYYADGYEAPWPQVGNEFKERYIKDAHAALEKIRRG